MKNPDETYLAHAQRLLAGMDLQDEEGSPTWVYELILALSHGAQPMHVTWEQANRLADFMHNELVIPFRYNA